MRVGDFLILLAIGACAVAGYRVHHAEAERAKSYDELFWGKQVQANEGLQGLGHEVSALWSQLNEINQSAASFHAQALQSFDALERPAPDLSGMFALASAPAPSSSPEATDTEGAGSPAWHEDGPVQLVFYVSDGCAPCHALMELFRNELAGECSHFWCKIQNISSPNGKSKYVTRTPTLGVFDGCNVPLAFKRQGFDAESVREFLKPFIDGESK